MDALFWIQSKLSTMPSTREELELNYKISELVTRSSREALAAVIEAYVADKESDFGDPDYDG